MVSFSNPAAPSLSVRTRWNVAVETQTGHIRFLWNSSSAEGGIERLEDEQKVEKQKQRGDRAKTTIVYVC